MLKNKVAIILLTVVMLFCIVFISSCENSNLIKDGEYNAVLVVQPDGISYWPTNFKIEIKDKKLFIEDEEMGTLSAGKVRQDGWMDPFDYHVKKGVDLDTLMKIKKCFVIDSANSFCNANYFYLISNNNNYYILFAVKAEECIRIVRVYILE